MLWIAVHLPRLPLEIFASPALPNPFAVSEAQRVVLCDACAHGLGVRSGMTLAAATAIAPQLEIRPREQAAEASSLLGVATWCSQFTPNVSLESPATVLLEISASLRLFGGLLAILRAQRQGLAAMGYTAAMACAPTPKAAAWLARANRQIAIGQYEKISAALEKLPVALAAGDEDITAALANIGVTTLGQLAALPRAGVARRFGKPLLAELDRAAGRMPDPRRWHQPPAYFKAGIELPSEATEADRLLFAAKRLVLQLEGYLAGRAAAVSRFTLKLRHREERATDVAIGLVTPSRDSGHFLLLLRERLERVALAEPVVSLRLEAEDIKPLAQENQSLFQDGRHGAGDWPRLIERLRSRLGNDAVQALELRPEHRPELASSHAEPGEKAVGTRCLAPRFGARPLWLLEQARALSEVHAVPLYGGKLKLLAGPERIESGWWDGKDVKRDYFVAATQDHALVWIYRERLAGERWSGLSGTSINGSWLHGRWFLHGLFG